MSSTGRTWTSAEDRRSVLDRAIYLEVLDGGRVEARGDFYAVIRFNDEPVNHILHLLVTLCTAGLWALSWLAITVVAHLDENSVSLTVDESGNVDRRKI